MNEHIRDARRAKGLTQSDFGLIVGKDQSWVSKLETGAIRADPDVALKVADVLKLDVVTVLYGPNATKRKRRRMG